MMQRNPRSRREAVKKNRRRSLNLTSIGPDNVQNDWTCGNSVSRMPRRGQSDVAECRQLPNGNANFGQFRGCAGGICLPHRGWQSHSPAVAAELARNGRFRPGYSDRDQAGLIRAGNGIRCGDWRERTKNAGRRLLRRPALIRNPGQSVALPTGMQAGRFP